jgi:hypothetical protein
MSGSSSPIAGSTPTPRPQSPGEDLPSPVVARPSLFPAGDVLVLSPPDSPPSPKDAMPKGPNCCETFFKAVADAFVSCWEAFCAFLRGLFCPVVVPSLPLPHADITKLEETERQLDGSPNALSMLRYYKHVLRWHLCFTDGSSAEQMRTAFALLSEEKKSYYTNLVAQKLAERRLPRIEGRAELRAFTASNTQGITAEVMQELERTKANEASLGSLTYDYIISVVDDAI